MPVKRTIPNHHGTFFITFTCHKWISLIDKVNGYDIIYKWFDYLKLCNHFINGYVIMPNHIHALISFTATAQTINTIIGNGKRFMAYEIIERLRQNNDWSLLALLAANVEATRKANNKKHEVWELSFDWKHCQTTSFAFQKLTYMHGNPCAGKWSLCKSPVDYIHSSAKFYISGEQGIYPVTNIAEMPHMDLTIK